MANLIYELHGVRGRSMQLYDTKCVINTEKTVGSFISGNITDGEKTIFLKDVVGVQFKKSGVMIGYLQFETPSMQMNNQKDNMFSENTFTFEEGKNGITNMQMDMVYHYVVDLIESIKYGLPTPAVPTMTTGRPDTSFYVQNPAPHYERPPVHAPTEGTWICRNCGTSNRANHGQCKKCGQYR